MKAKTYRLLDTRITTAGVMRCCLLDAALEYRDKPIKLGDKTACPHCKTAFTLIWCHSGYPLWKPDWQLEKK